MEEQHSAAKKGKVYLVGAGPGDPGLITVRGRYLLEKAEVVVYDYLASRRLLRYVPAEATFVYAGKRGGGQHTHTQDEINQMLVDFALQGKTVIRLKGGDPFIFGRGGEELETLARHNIDFEVVPGVTSATAAATYAGIPITHREYTATVAFLTGHEDPTKESSKIDWAKIATGIGTIVVYMGIKNLPNIVKNLMDHGRSPETPVAVVRWASTPEQQSVVGTLATIADIVAEAGIKPPALIVIGEVVNLRDTIDWFEKRKLFGRRIIVTRTRDQASELVAALEENGASCYECSTINIEPVDDYSILDEALERIDEYHWILFTSLNGVKYFFKRLYDKGLDARDLKGPDIATVGKSTADELHRYG
ncbi:MAG: uroporphyrinogen-III C-methyltransferase, partial [Desulfofustis sp.]|nr:uroporphyrinogen-III C-methyltransferase [Desulfofustis sp.]